MTGCPKGNDGRMAFFERYLFQDGKRYMTVEHAADQILAANDAAVMAAVKIIEGYRPNNPELILAVKALSNRGESMGGD